MFFGNFHAVGAGEQARLSKTLCVLDILLYPASLTGPTMGGPREKSFKIKVLRRLGTAVSRLVLQTKQSIRESFY